MNKRDIFVLIAVMIVLAVRLYMRYKKKDSNNLTSDNRNSAGSGFLSSQKDDDYEPYSKK